MLAWCYHSFENHLSSKLNVSIFHFLDNQERTLKCWYVMPAIRATTPSVSSQPWSPFQLTHGSAEWATLFFFFFFNSTCLKLLGNMLVYIRLPTRICFLFFPYSMFFRGVVFVRNVVSEEWGCQVHLSGLRTILCAKPASVTAALCVVCAANLPVQPWPCSVAVYATGQWNAQAQSVHRMSHGRLCYESPYIVLKKFLWKNLIVVGGCMVSARQQGSFQKPSALACFARSCSLSLNQTKQKRKLGRQPRRVKDRLIW